MGSGLVGEAAISFIFEGGAFTAEDTHNTYMALLYYLPIIVTQGMQYIVSKSMYARGKTSTIFRISVTTILLNVVLNWMFVGPFGYAGLAITSSVVSVYFLSISIFIVYRDFERGEKRKLASLFIRVLIPTLIMAVPLYLIKRFTPISEWYSIIQIGILIPLGALFYALGLYAFYRDAFNQLLTIVRRRGRGK